MHVADNRMGWWCVAGLVSLTVALSVLFRHGPSRQRAPTNDRSIVERPRTVARSPAGANPRAQGGGQESPHGPERDFAAAMRAAMQRGDELNDEREVFELGYRWVATDPESALGFVQELPFDNTLLLVALGGEWARRDPLAAATWAARLPDSASRTRVLVSMVAVWAEAEPVEATRFAARLAPAAVQTEAIVSAISGWARLDPPAALEWAGQLAEGKLRDQIYTQAAFTWGQRDPVSAAEWVLSMPGGRAWDSAASALCGVLVERHPALALSLAAEISDHSLRRQRIENVGKRWLDSDRAAAEKALLHAGFSADFAGQSAR